MREAPDLRHRSIDGTLAFADISGFTSLTERLSKKGKVGAEEMNDVLDSAFTDLLSVAYDYGAAVIKWGGDATLLLFTGDGHPARACRAAVEMQRTMRSIGRLKTSAGRVTLRMSVGIHTDLFDFFFVGKLHRELVIAGAAADATVAAESSADAGETVITRTTAAMLEPSHVGGRRGDCYLLAGAPALKVDRAPSVGDVADIDLERCVPVAISSHLVEGGGEAEHRPLTIAFLRFAGVSELIATAGVDAVSDALELTLDTAEGIALEHKVAFFDTDIAAGGGKIMLVSGAPTSSGHDEERMMRSLRAIADSQLPLQLHIGVDRGRLLAADFGPPYRRTYSFKGDAANLAARLMTKAAAGQILATSEVLARSRTEFHAEPLEPFSVKGKSEPVQAFLVGSAAGLRFQRGDAPLVGRDEELRTLLEGVASARRYDGRIVEVVGDPGIGKSRLIEELGENVSPDVFIQVQCDEYEATTPYHPFQGLLRSLLSTNSSGDEITPARLRHQVERGAPQLLPWLPLLAVPVGLELPDTPETEPLQGEFRRRRLHEAVVDLLGMLLLRPTVIVFEDVHWLDEASAELLNHLSLTLEARPWLVVATRRDRPTTFSVPDEANPVQVWLEPLTADASSELIERTLGELPLTARQAEELAGRAGGNPLFLTELLAAAQRTDGLEELPDSVEALMIREIDRLSPPARRMLRSAAVVGATFDLDLLRTCLGEPWDDETWTSLEPFMVAQEGDAYRFRHMLARDAAYEGLPYRRRRELHARVGDELVSRAGDPEDEAGLLSLHYFHAHRFDEAWHYSRTAAGWAQTIWANVDAGAFYERALASGRHLREVAGADLATVAESLGDVRWRAGQFEDAGEAFRHARALIKGDVLAEARIVLKQAAILSGPALARYTQALRWLKRAERLLEAENSIEAARLLAEMYGWRASVRNFQGRFRESVASCRLAIEEAERSGEQRALAHAYYLLDWAYVALGEPERAIYSQQALAIYGELRDLPRQADVYNNLGAFAYLEGRWTDALELYERGRELRERIGDPVHAANGTLNIAEIFTDQGRLTEAEQLCREALRVWRGAGLPASAAFATRQLGRVAARAGRYEDAFGLFEEARAALVKSGAQGDANETDSSVAECLVLEGRGHEALDRLTPALARAEKSGGFELPQLMRVRGFALLQLGDEGAPEALDAALAEARKRGSEYEAALSITGLLRTKEPDESSATSSLENGMPFSSDSVWSICSRCRRAPMGARRRAV